MMLVLDMFPEALRTQVLTLYNIIALLMCFVVTRVIGYISDCSKDIFYSLFLILPLVSLLLFLGRHCLITIDRSLN